MTLNLILRYVVPKNHDAFAYLIDGMIILTYFLKCRY